MHKPDPLTESDSPLSITSSVTGVLTFIVAIVAAVYVRISYLRDSEQEFFRVKASLSWYKRESEWMNELVQAAGQASHRPPPPPVSSGPPNDNHQEYQRTTEYQMYTFVMEQLNNLEQRLLDIVEEVEVHSVRAGNRATRALARAETFLPRRWSWMLKTAASHREQEEAGWTFVPRSWARRERSVAVAWLPVRNRALELVKQRDALTARLLFTQTSMISSRIRDLERRAGVDRAREERVLARLEEMISQQRDEIKSLKEGSLAADHAQEPPN